MAKEFNDVYGQTDLDYAREFDEYSAEEKFNNIKLKEQIEDVNELIAGKKQLKVILLFLTYVLL